MEVLENNTLSESAWILRLAIKNEEARDLTSNCLKTFVIYVAVVGSLAKFSLDANANEELKMALSTLGLVVAVLGSLSCVFAESVRRAIEGELQEISERLGIPHKSSVLVPSKYIAIIGVPFSGLTLVGWIILLASD